MSQPKITSRDHVLLTGATGFLGQHLLRDLLSIGQMVAVVVRPSGKWTAEERVEKLLKFWEVRAGVQLPRPHVIGWDIASDDRSALSQEDCDWIARNVGAILHGAASVRFTPDSRTREPHRTNVEGTRNLCSLARQHQLAFHFVSTAYVCGEVSGRVFERLHHPLRFRNVYEQSKHMAEQLLTEHRSELGSLTIYRPSIIVGDSKTGFASTFQTVYSGLRLAVAWPGSADKANVDAIMKSLQLSGNESKNMVPVDWVARSITDILANPKAHNVIYHLTNAHTISIGRLTESMVEAANAQPSTWHELKSSNADAAILPDIQRVFLESFQEYFCEDPTFDRTSLKSVLPNCDVVVDSDSLLRMFEFAIRMRFRDVEGNWDQVPEFESITAAKDKFDFQSGYSDFPWELKIVSSSGAKTIRFHDRQSDDVPTIIVSESAFSQLSNKKCTETMALQKAELLVLAEREQQNSLLQCFRHYMNSSPASITLDESINPHDMALLNIPLDQGVL